MSSNPSEQDDYIVEQGPAKPLAQQHVEQFFFLYFGSRSRHQFLLAMPAVVLFFVFAGVFAAEWRTSEKDLIERYQTAAEEALKRRNIEAAELYHQKLEQLEPSGDHGPFHAALRLADAGETEKAMTQMQVMAPLDQPGMLSAHVWIASVLSQELLATDEIDAEKIEIIEQHINHAATIAPGSTVPKRLLAELFEIKGEPAKALEILDSVVVVGVEDKLALRTRIANIQLKLGNHSAARDAFNEVVGDFEQLQREEYDLSAYSFATWAAAAEGIGQKAEAAMILVSAMQRDPEDASLRESYLKLGVRRLEATTAPALVVDLCVDLLKYVTHDSVEVLERIADQTSDPEVHEELQQLLENQARHEPLPATVYDRLGMAAMMRQDYEDAKKYYEAFIEQQPKQHVALNNLAWAIIHSDDPDPDRALMLIDEAIALAVEKEAHVASMHGTRGHILFEMERWEEAINELLQGVNGQPFAPTHRVLADAYRKVGNDELAQVHLSAARQIEGSLQANVNAPAGENQY